MCLDRLDNSFKPCDIGYQVKRKTQNGFTALYYADRRNPVNNWNSKVGARTVLKIGESYRAVETTIGDWNNRYTAGFHVFHTIEDAKTYLRLRKSVVSSLSFYSIIKVETGGKKTTGRQARLMVTVATAITLLEEVAI